MIPPGSTGLPQPAPRARFVLFLLLWLALFVALLSLYNYTYESIAAVAVHHLQVRPAAALLGWTLPAEAVRAVGPTLESTGVRMTLIRGCDGVEAWLLLFTALIAFPMPLRCRLTGLLWGTVMVFGLNLLRIVSLFHLVRVRPAWFETAHDLVWQSLMVAAIGCFAWLWMRDPAPSHSATEAAP